MFQFKTTPFISIVYIHKTTRMTNKNTIP